MRALLTAMVLVSVTASACPDLSGSYPVCRSTTGASSGSTDMTVTQLVRNGITTYTVVSTDEETGEIVNEIIIADGRSRSEATETEIGTLTITTTASCNGETLLQDIRISAPEGDLAHTNAKISKSQTTLKNEMSGEIFGNEFQDTIICE